MRIKDMHKTIAIILVLFLNSLVFAETNEEYRTIAYYGQGSQINDSKNPNTDTPFSIGFMTQSSLKDSNLILGIDFAEEGTKLTSVTGIYNPEDIGFSLNLLIGSNLYDKNNWKVDGTYLIGFREISETCPSSYLGFRCWANLAADAEYKINYGGVVMVSYDKFSVGTRITGVSKQVLAGYRF